MRKELTRLFQPESIGRVEIRNRIVMAAMGAGYATEDGYVTDRLIAFHEARARRGVGLISAGGLMLQTSASSRCDFRVSMMTNRYRA